VIFLPSAEKFDYRFSVLIFSVVKDCSRNCFPSCQNSHEKNFLFPIFLSLEHGKNHQVRTSLAQVRWELQGLDDVMKPTHFGLGVKGALYTDRRGVRSRLKGQLEMKISVILPQMLSLVPEDLLRSVSESVSPQFQY